MLRRTSWKAGVSMKISVMFGAFLVAGALMVWLAMGSVRAQESSVEEEMKVHRLTSTLTSPYDAFAYVNRLSETLADDESPEDFAGRLFGRLANQEGRVLLKIPPGFTPLAYDGLKIFYEYDRKSKAGNCVACHVPPYFTDGKKHVADASGGAQVTATLRNLAKGSPYYHDDSLKTLEDVLAQKMRMSARARAGDAEGIDSAYKNMYLSAEDIPALIEFLSTVNEIPREDFRQLILKSKLLDTTEMIER